MQPKTARESITVMTHQMMPNDTNPYGNIHGGVIMKHIDEAAACTASRHSRSNAVTASIDRLDFLRPSHVGELVTCKACINYTGRTSMEIGVRVEAENMNTGEVRHVASAYLTFVALDGNNKPTDVPQLILETPMDQRRHQEAQNRRKHRLLERNLESE